ncbi:glycosyltransferase family 9 protein [Actinophytocola gossypii]|uniref:Glycosyltransferase family 9 protein n=1 Tax=Actinophytocola gossypii TaxID=2812003 RepID=A0ABT2J6K3_9PSEU|nr:glycosyltransferase family 9 protein [Actinophytocola gossypii]MCT2583490.1 glycosyltransferase family 9 protein [Actinophytocola gossypii]
MNERPTRHPAADLGAPPDWSAIRRILVVRADNLGDVVLATPALRALRRAAPHAVIDLLASPVGATVAPMIPAVREVITVSASWQQAGGAAGSAHAAAAKESWLVERIRGRRYDAMLVFTSHGQSPWPAAHVGMLAGICLRAVHSTEFGGAVATHWVTPPPEGTHQADRCLHLLGALGVPPAGPDLELSIPHTDRAPGRAFALLAPGGSCPSKRYPADRYADVARHVAESGLAVLVTGSPKEAALVDEVVTGAAHPDVAPLGDVTVPELAGVVAAADVVLCNNSGCLHLADAAGTPVVATYAGTERLTDMPPRNTTAELLSRPVPCAPCRQFRCPYHQECLDLDPADVAAAALRLTTEVTV